MTLGRPKIPTPMTVFMIVIVVKKKSELYEDYLPFLSVFLRVGLIFQHFHLPIAHEQVHLGTLNSRYCP